NDVPTRLARRRSHRVDFGDDIGRQSLDAVEIVFHDLIQIQKCAAELPLVQCDGIRPYAQLRCFGNLKRFRRFGLTIVAIRVMKPVMANNTPTDPTALFTEMLKIQGDAARQIFGSFLPAKTVPESKSE